MMMMMIIIIIIPRDVVCLRNISINTLHKRDDYDYDDDDDDDNNVTKYYSSWRQKFDQGTN